MDRVIDTAAKLACAIGAARNPGRRQGSEPGVNGASSRELI
jgi:hypothetical protein